LKNDSFRLKKKKRNSESINQSNFRQTNSTLHSHGGRVHTDQDSKERRKEDEEVMKNKVKEANLTGKIDRIEIIDPVSLVKVNEHR
jgi:hypothetical protein